jgi:hypothetical protein
MLHEFDFTVVLEPIGRRLHRERAGGSVVTEGDTEAMAMAEDAIRLVLAYRRDHGLVYSLRAESTEFMKANVYALNKCVCGLVKIVYFIACFLECEAAEILMH